MGKQKEPELPARQTGAPPPPVIVAAEKTADWREFGFFWYRVLAALSRIAAAYLFFNLGPWVDQSITGRLPNTDGWRQVKDVVDGSTIVSLIIMHGYLLWDMLAVFMPRLRGRKGAS